MNKATNILNLMADEHQACALFSQGHPVVKTPNLERLANRGTVFRMTCAPSQMCVPASAAVAAGQYAHKAGYWDIAHAFVAWVSGWGHVPHLAGDPTHSDQPVLMRENLPPICNLRAIDAAAPADQDRLVARFGGLDRAFETGHVGASPNPN